MRLKTRRQEQLALALALALAVVVFEVWPRLDIAVSTRFFDGQAFVGNQWAWANLIYHGVPRLGTWLVLLAIALAVLPLLGAWAPKLVGVGLVVHTILKDNWGRPRPEDVQVFGGPKIYQAPLQPSSQCERNCSFVSGHAAGGFALMAVGLMGSRRTRWRWWAVGTLAGSVVGLTRIVQGRHFFGDIVFCMLALWLVCVVLRELWLRVVVLRRRSRIRRALSLT